MVKANGVDVGGYEYLWWVDYGGVHFPEVSLPGISSYSPDPRLSHRAPHRQRTSSGGWFETPLPSALVGLRAFDRVPLGRN
jgi:hypothetical protein